MKENEIDALIKLGIYLCVCKDVEILKKLLIMDIYIRIIIVVWQKEVSNVLC